MRKNSAVVKYKSLNIPSSFAPTHPLNTPVVCSNAALVSARYHFREISALPRNKIKRAPRRETSRKVSEYPGVQSMYSNVTWRHYNVEVIDKKAVRRERRRVI